MCGISGVFDLVGERQIDSAVLKRMNDTQIHRGPDGEGYHFEPGVGFGHRRLSIIDLAGGAQPMFNEDGTVVVTYNGEMYDFADLRAELRAVGHVFKTRCDTEVIVHAWEEWGEECLERLLGMFAFALWDRNRKCLFLARDRFGKKPLYYSRLSTNELIFASELKALLAHPATGRAICPTAIEDYLSFGYVPDPKTIFEGIYKLPPGCFLKVERGSANLEPRRYWDIGFKADFGWADETELCGDLLARLDDAVRKRMIADVPLGAFLSGGVDSSAVVSSMARLSDEPVNTCSISFGDPEFNEARYAQQIADQLKTNHSVEQVDPDDFELVNRINSIYDEPFADSSAIPTYRVCQLTRNHVTVALSGDGGDEVFAGYGRYRWHMNEQKLRGLLPDAIRRNVIGFLGSIYPDLVHVPKIFRAKSTLQAIARDPLDAYQHSISIFPTEERQSLLSESFKSTLQGYSSRQVFMDRLATCNTDDQLSKIQYLDMHTYLPGDILTKVDRASMAHSLEVRVPLLDPEFVEWACTIPSWMKLKKGEGKHIFKKALRARVPDDILYRKKMGFAVPLATWFRGPLREQVENRILGTAMVECEVFNMRYVRALLERHMERSADNSHKIWALLVFEGFYRSLAGQPG